MPATRLPNLSMADHIAQVRIGVIGLGYVGLPLTVAFGQHLPTLGYDIDAAGVQ